MIKVEGKTVVLLCDCHRGRPQQMARVEHGVLTIMSYSHQNLHVIRVPLDKLGTSGLELDGMVDGTHRLTI